MKTWKKIKKNQHLWEKYFLREKIIYSIRIFFHQEKFHEVETPLLVPAVIPESYLDVFTAELKKRQGEKQQMFLATSPEASIKKLLAAGIGNCFEITKSFRNSETGSSFHNPEFTILEWYRVNSDYKDIMRDCEKLLLYIGKKAKINYQGKEIDLSAPWERITVSSAFKRYAGINFDEIIQIKDNKAVYNLHNFRNIAFKKGYRVEKNSNWETLFQQIFFNEIEPYLGKNKPVILYEYPSILAALSKIKKDDVRFAERFEFYIGGLELGDCYTELTDYQEQKTRFADEVKLIAQSGKTKVKADNDFLEAIKSGLPNCSGIAVGVDRLVMLLTDSKTIEETLLFPVNTMVDV